MSAVTHFLVQHGYLLLLVWVFVEQIGVPLPAAPVLLAAGALAGAGHLNIWISGLVALVAALLSDVIWYEIGRQRGNTMLRLLCRISLQPDSCARRTQKVYDRHGASSLLLAKFIPWLNTAAPPLAGAFGMRFITFLLFDTYFYGPEPSSVSVICSAVSLRGLPITPTSRDFSCLQPC